MLNNSNLQRQGHKITIKMMMDAQIWISNSILKAEIMKNVDEADKPIKRGGNKRFKKKSKLNSLNIEKSSNEMVLTTKQQPTVGLTNELLSTKSEKSILLHSKTKIRLWTSCAKCKNINTIPEKWKKNVDCNNDINLQSGIYLFFVLQYSNFTLCKYHYGFFCGRLQLIGTKAAILVVRIRQFWKGGSNHHSLFQLI